MRALIRINANQQCLFKPKSCQLKPNHHGKILETKSDIVIVPSAKCSSTRLAEIGKFKIKQSDSNLYEPGQTFLHKIFGYRGVTVFSWSARVHDNDLGKQHPNNELPSNIGTIESHNRSHQHQSCHANDQSDSSSPSLSSSSSQKEEPSYNGKSSSHINQCHPYYQVLIDARDCPFVSNRTQTEAVTFLGHPNNSKSVYSVKGLDYVSHDDIIPYVSHEQQPIQHELCNKLFILNKDTSEGVQKFRSTELLVDWRSKHPWLDLSQVYRETTENVRVTVIPFYLGHTIIEDTPFHWWRYCVRLENFSDVSVQLRERHWKIFSATNMLQTIKGRGVVGVEPKLDRCEPAYQYSSHVNLSDRSGHMWGFFKMQREDGHTFECKIPPFSLESSIDNVTPPSSKRR